MSFSHVLRKFILAFVFDSLLACGNKFAGFTLIQLGPLLKIIHDSICLQLHLLLFFTQQDMDLFLDSCFPEIDVILVDELFWKHAFPNFHVETSNNAWAHNLCMPKSRLSTTE